MRALPVLLLATVFGPGAAALDVASTFELDLPGGPAATLGTAVEGSTLHLAWSRAGGGTLHYGILDLTSSTWAWRPAPPVGNLTPPPVGAFPQLGLVDGGVVVVWQEAGPGDQDIDVRVASFSADGQALDARTVADDASRQILPKVACGAAACAVVWAQESAPNAADWHVMGARIGANVGPAVRISDNPDSSPADFPDLVALEDGSFLVAWADRRDATGHQIRGARWGGVGESTPVSFPLSPANASGVRTAVSLARGPAGVMAAWVDAPFPSHRGISVATSTDDGATWRTLPTGDWTTAGSKAQHPLAFAGPSGGILVGWEDARWGLPQFVVAEADDAGTWSVAPVAPVDAEIRRSTGHPVVVGADLHLLVPELAGDARRLVVQSTGAGLSVSPDPSNDGTQSSPGPVLVAVLGLLALVAAARRRR